MRIYLVGGAVRDSLLNYPSSENDWVVVGATPEQMTDQGFKPVGQDFPVFIHPKTSEEYALARTERKSGHGYKGFEFYTSTDVTLEEDLIRRDLTINAMAQDEAGNVIDPFGGQRDLGEKLLRHVSYAFTEDPLRVLRVARFAARYHHLGFTIAEETMELLKSIVDQGEMEFLVAERVWKETSRALTEQSPHIYIEVLRNCGALNVLFPEIDALFGVPQRADYHPEVDTGIHTLMALEQAVKISDSGAVRFSVLVHDVGKALTPDTVLPSHTGHETSGIPLVQAMCDRLGVPNQYRQLAMAVTEYHLHSHKAKELKPATMLKLFQSIGALRDNNRLKDFLYCCEADARGRAGFEEITYQPKKYLTDALLALQKVDISDLVADGVKGSDIGVQLKQRQIEQLTIFKSENL
ncbi:MAG: multifunctional CCA addition/repair protein [Puniceicoccaceae bacterium]|mgnify:FL=1|nr:multifunctional CCA addition/repair protein [Puniceicoccaceae bacterium]MAV39114.1 multifunctional CCA addition/repair protein [Puniceicoccaceae bacterium]